MLIGTAAALAITTLPGTAAADPSTATTPQQAAQLVADASQRLEGLSEQVNEAREVLTQQQWAALAAHQQVEQSRAQLDSLDGQIRQVARSAYTGASDDFATLDLLMTSDSAEDFVSSLAMLDQIAGHTTGVLDEVSDAAEQAEQAQAEADAAQAAVDTALAQVGDRYVFGAGGPDAFDCSGLTQYAYAAAGISLPHSSRMQSQMGTAVSRAELQPGDLLFFYSPVSHVAMYIGNGQMVHASTSSQPVKVVSIDSMGGITAMRRIV